MNTTHPASRRVAPRKTHWIAGAVMALVMVFGLTAPAQALWYNQVIVGGSQTVKFLGFDGKTYSGAPGALIQDVKSVVVPKGKCVTVSVSASVKYCAPSAQRTVTLPSSSIISAVVVKQTNS